VDRRATQISNLQENVFFLKAGISGTVVIDANGDGHAGSHEQPLSHASI
jgi:hypothetical protein